VHLGERNNTAEVLVKTRWPAAGARGRGRWNQIPGDLERALRPHRLVGGVHPSERGNCRDLVETPVKCTVARRGGRHPRSHTSGLFVR
jgi:hypothetical protein